MFIHDFQANEQSYVSFILKAVMENIQTEQRTDQEPIIGADFDLLFAQLYSFAELTIVYFPTAILSPMLFAIASSTSSVHSGMSSAIFTLTQINMDESRTDGM